MLNLETLRIRLKAWSERFCSTIEPVTQTGHPSPILLYQIFFSLMHDLKSSIHLSGDNAVRKLVDTVMASDTHLFRLAYDELELDEAGNQSLYELGKNLNKLGDIQCLLETSMNTASPTPEEELELFKLHFPWEGLSRARASSCARHGYRFYSWEEHVALSDLPTYDESFAEEVRHNLGIVIVRKLETAPTHQEDGAEPALNLLLSTLTVAAFAPGAKSPSKRWEPIGSFQH